MISNLFPTTRHPRGGTFINQRIEAHRTMGNHVEAVALNPTAARGWAPIFRAIGRGDSPLLGSEYLEMMVTVPVLNFVRRERSPFPSASFLEMAAERIQQLVDMASFDVIHAHGMYMVPAGAVAHRLSASTGVPYAITAHGGDINLMMPHQSKAYARVLDSAGAVAYVSNALRSQALALGAKGENATVIPNGVDCSLFMPPEPASGTETPRAGPQVAFVGNLFPVKGADWLPDIFRGIAAKMPKTSFVIAGDGPLRSSVESAMSGLTTKFLGNIPQKQVAQVLRDADLAVLPSRSEGWPCVVLEAHASDTPMIGSDAGGTPEAIGDPRFVITLGNDFVERFINTAVRVLQGVIAPDDLRSHALGHSWQITAARETDMLQRVVRRPSARR